MSKYFPGFLNRKKDSLLQLRNLRLFEETLFALRHNGTRFQFGMEFLPWDGRSQELGIKQPEIIISSSHILQWNKTAKYDMFIYVCFIVFYSNLYTLTLIQIDLNILTSRHDPVSAGPCLVWFFDSYRHLIERCFPPKAWTRWQLCGCGSKLSTLKIGFYKYFLPTYHCLWANPHKLGFVQK